MVIFPTVLSKLLFPISHRGADRTQSLSEVSPPLLVSCRFFRARPVSFSLNFCFPLPPGPPCICIKGWVREPVAQEAPVHGSPFLKAVRPRDTVGQHPGVHPFYTKTTLFP